MDKSETGSHRVKEESKKEQHYIQRKRLLNEVKQKSFVYNADFQKLIFLM